MVNKESGIRLWRFCMSKNDRAAMDYLKEELTFGSLVQVIRYVLKKQAERDVENAKGELTKKTVTLMERIKELTVNEFLKGRKKSVKSIGWSCWLHPKELKQLEQIAKQWGFERDAEAMRFAIRVEAELSNFKPENGWSGQEEQ